MKLTKEQLKDFLDEKAAQYENSAFIDADPVSIPHLFSKREDIEISGFLTATISWGQRVTILKNATRLMSLMDDAPFDFVKHASSKELKRLDPFVHRTFNGKDAQQMVLALRAIYEEGGLENYFVNKKSMMQSIHDLHSAFVAEFKDARTNKHIADPLKGASAKRINMYLRWMVRGKKGGVDFGIWKKVSPSQLYCPLDVHSGNVARALGLLKRKQNDWKAVEELTEALRKMDPKDPVKYDFALFGLGVFEGFP